MPFSRICYQVNNCSARALIARRIIDYQIRDDRCSGRRSNPLEWDLLGRNGARDGSSHQFERFPEQRLKLLVRTGCLGLSHRGIRGGTVASEIQER